jgi:hypothetical protein
MSRPLRVVAAVVALVGLGHAATAQDIQKFNAHCHDWIAKRGYSVNYIEECVGKRQPGFGRGWVGNIDRDTVRAGDVAIFMPWHGHTAYVEKVERGTDGKPGRIEVSDWNRPGRYLDEACIVTEHFGKLSTWSVDAAQVTRYRRP